MTPLTRVDAGGCSWRVPAGLRDALLGPNGLRLDDWLRTGQAAIVKQGPHRTVFRVTLPEMSFYVKHYPVTDLRSWLRQLVRPAKARTEHDCALELTARGIPTYQPLAHAERRHGVWPGDSILLTHSLDATETLSAFIETTLPRLAPQRRQTIRQRLALALGAFVARMHDAGVLHQDFHPANLLVRLADDERLNLFLIDLHAVRLTGPLDWRTSRQNLVILNRWFALRVGRSDRLRFWRAYVQTRGAAAMRSWVVGVLGAADAPPAIRHAIRPLARDLEQRTWRSNLDFWKRRDRRCLVTNRYYRRVRSGKARGYAVTDLDAATTRALLGDPDAPFVHPGAKLLKNSPSSTVAEFEALVGGVQRRVIYKRFRVTSWRDPWVSLLRRSPALRSWVFGHGLRERCLPTARPLLVLHRRRNGMDHEGYLLTEKIEHTAELHQCLAELQAVTREERQRRVRHVIDQAARLICELHRRNLSHRDLKAANLLVAQSDSAATAVWLIDLVGVHLYRRLRRKRRVQNLARLNASFHNSTALTRTDRLRFLRTYLQWGLRGRGGWKRWWRAIEHLTLAKATRNRRVGRPLA